MARVELEFDDKGEILGEKLPPELDALFKRTETAGYGNGLKKGREDTLKETAAQHEAALKAEREKWEKENPVGRVRELETELGSLRESEAEKLTRYNKNAREREEVHAKEIADKAEAIAKRDRRLGDMLRSSIRSEAIGAGAREESLAELEMLLSARVAYDDEFQPYVKDETGRPMEKTGKPVTVSEFVKDYISTHPHHRKPTAGQGGGARGGAGYSGHTVTTEAAAVAAIDSGDRSPTAINALFEATRKKRAS